MGFRGCWRSGSRRGCTHRRLRSRWSHSERRASNFPRNVLRMKFNTDKIVCVLCGERTLLHSAHSFADARQRNTVPHRPTIYPTTARAEAADLSGSPAGPQPLLSLRHIPSRPRLDTSRVAEHAPPATASAPPTAQPSVHVDAAPAHWEPRLRGCYQRARCGSPANGPKNSSVVLSSALEA